LIRRQRGRNAGGSFHCEETDSPAAVAKRAARSLLRIRPIELLRLPPASSSPPVYMETVDSTSALAFGGDPCGKAHPPRLEDKQRRLAKGWSPLRQMVVAPKRISETLTGRSR